MGNKIIVEFDKRKLKKMCPLTDWCKTCSKDDEQLLQCHITRAEYRIKEQNNGKS